MQCDQVMRHLLEPELAAEFEIVRADLINSPGDINQDIIVRLHKSDLVVADLTDQNANVMWEVGLRHAFNKPIVTICKSDQKFPFDLISHRHIKYDLTDPDKLDQSRAQIKRFVESAMKQKRYVGPVAAALGMATFQREDVDAANVLLSMEDKLDEISSQVLELNSGISEVEFSLPDAIPADTLQKIDAIHEIISLVRPWDLDRVLNKLRSV
ncbi:hypothetical protein A9199_08340 [Donghicola sp. JL3646]|nr:hypothetical protein A9199_08340 [Donghicola sp. JL3646]